MVQRRKSEKEIELEAELASIRNANRRRESKFERGIRSKIRSVKLRKEIAKERFRSTRIGRAAGAVGRVKSAFSSGKPKKKKADLGVIKEFAVGDAPRKKKKARKRSTQKRQRPQRRQARSEPPQSNGDPLGDFIGL